MRQRDYTEEEEAAKQKVLDAAKEAGQNIGRIIGKAASEHIAALEAEVARLRMRNGYLATGLEGERAVMQAMSTNILSYVGWRKVPPIAVVKGWAEDLQRAAIRADKASADSTELPDQTLSDNARLRTALAAARDAMQQVGNGLATTVSIGPWIDDLTEAADAADAALNTEPGE